MLDLSIVIPIYNEEIRLQKSLPIIKKFLEQNKKNKIEIIFVSDGSNDNTNLIVEKFKSKNNKKLKIKFIKYKINVGKGYAVKKVF